MTLKKPLPPPQYDTLMSLKREMYIELNCVKPGQIVTYDPVTRTARAQIGLSQVLADGSVRSYPPLLDCPVVTLQGGGIGASFPIEPGDECLIFFSDRCLDAWVTNGGSNPPPDGRLHDMSDGIVLVGLNSLVNPVTLALLTDEGGIADAFAKVAIKDGKISISNQTETLFAILTDLVTVLLALNTTLASMTTASIAAGTTQTTIATYTTTFSGLITRIAALLYP